MVRDVFLDRFADGLLQAGGAELSQQLQQSGRGSTEVGPALCQACQQFPAGRRCCSKSVQAAVLPGLTLVLGEPFDVGGVLDLLMAVEAATVFGYHRTDSDSESAAPTG